jgi:hypothetical protein
MSLSAIAASVVLGICSINNSPPALCMMGWSVDNGNVAVAWKFSDNTQIALGGPVRTDNAFDVVAIQVNYGDLFRASGQCNVRINIVSCAFNAANTTNTFTFRPE